MKKNVAIDALNKMPKNFELDRLLEELIVIDKIDKALIEEKEGKTIDHELVKKQIKKWLK
jgi:hypothetical protein